MWSTGEGNGKPLQYSCLENPMKNMKRQNDRIPKEELPRSLGAQYASGEIIPQRMKGWSQSKNNTQLWMWLVIEARSSAIKSNTVIKFPFDDSSWQIISKLYEYFECHPIGTLIFDSYRANGEFNRKETKFSLLRFSSFTFPKYAIVFLFLIKKKLTC